MPTALEFAKAFERATEQSSSEPLFFDILTALDGELDSNKRFAKIKLNTKRRGSDSTVIENAVREKFGDDLARSRYPDAMFKDTPVEVKHTTSGFGKLPTDSYGLSRTTKKWYLFVKGNIDRGGEEELGAWLMRSDKLYEQIEKLLPTTSQVSLFPDLTNAESIDPQSDDALQSIENEIKRMTSQLADTILKRSTGKDVQRQQGEMSLGRRVGLNRVRFDIKFESLLRSCVKEILRS